MALEPDQTRWRGVRPTDPPEDIPTTTKKLAPAIGDLQAVKGLVGDARSATGKNITVEYVKAMTAVPAGEIWVITNVHIINVTSMCDYTIHACIVAPWYTLKMGFSIPAGQGLTWTGTCVLEEGDYMAGTFKLGGVADDVILYGVGYTIGVY